MSNSRYRFPIPEKQENETDDEKRFRLETKLMALEEYEAQGWNCTKEIFDTMQSLRLLGSDYV